MQDGFVIELQDEVAGSDLDAIVQGLTDYNASQTKGETPAYLVLSLRSAAGELMGGLVGSTYLGWLQVHAVWLEEALRGKGMGSALMRRAEAEALRRGCRHAFLETFSFQALPFYRKLGYEVVNRIADFPPGGARYALTKRLDSGTGA